MFRSVFLLGLLFATPVLAHSWYDPQCCDGRDCEVYIHEIVPLPGGDYRLANGQIVKASSVKRSQDDKFHLCRWDGVISCFYVPDGRRNMGQGPWNGNGNGNRNGNGNGAGPVAAPGGPAVIDPILGPVLRRNY